MRAGRQRGGAWSTVAMALVALVGSPRDVLALRAPHRVVAIQPLQPLGTDQEIVHRLQSILEAEVARLHRVKVRRCGAAPAPVGVAQHCGGDRACLIRLGTACRVSSVVYGTVGALGDSYVLDLKLMGVRRQKVLRRKTVLLSGDSAVLIDAVRVAATELIAPEQYLGAVELRLERAGAAVHVDGKLQGTTPLPRLDQLTPGDHTLRVQLDGFEVYERVVPVQCGRTTVVNLSPRGSVIDDEIASEELPTVVAEGAADEQAGAGLDELGGDPYHSPLFLAGLSSSGIGVLALTAGAIGLGVYLATVTEMQPLTTSTAGRDPNDTMVVVREAEAYQPLYDRAALSWNVAIGGGLVAALALTAGFGMGGWALLAPAPSDAD